MADGRPDRSLHADIITAFVGRDGLCDAATLESTADAPRNCFVYGEDADIFDPAATLAHGISRNHPFIDGNKRVALQSLRVFLFLNDYAFEPDVIETVTTVEELAAGDVDVAALARWVKKSCRKS